MTLIKEMLENLERRNGTEPNKPEPERRKNKVTKPKRPRKYKDILTQRFWLGSVVTASSFVVLIAAFFLIYNSYTKNAYTAKIMSKNATAVPEQKMEYRAVTSNAVHQMYLSAIDDLNEGKVEKALAELKIILKEDPKFSPARETYQAIQSRYGINATP